MKVTEKYAGKELSYPVSKTLTFQLVPVGKTRQFIEEKNILESDLDKLEKSKKVKGYLDRIHRSFIQDILAKNILDVTELERLFTELQKETDAAKKAGIRKLIRTEEDKKRNEISSWFHKEKDFKELFGAAVFKNKIKDFTTENELKDVEVFNRFTQYFVSYNEGREHIYSKDDTHDTIAFRIVNENFRIYFENLHKLNDAVPGTDALRSFPLTDAQIADYNQVISGNPAEGRKGYNQTANELEEKIPLLKKLYKNILSESTPLFSVEKFASTNDVIESIKDFVVSVKETFVEFELLARYKKNPDGIYVSRKRLANFSLLTTGKPLLLSQVVKTELKEVPEYVSVGKLKEMFFKQLEENPKFEGEEFNPEKYFAMTALVEKTRETLSALDFGKITDLQHDKAQVLPLKVFLDSALELYHHVLTVHVDEEEFTDKKDEGFYNILGSIEEYLSPVTIIYNKTRNFVTKKLSKEEKIPLNFDSPTLLSGWDINKESTSNSMLFHDESEDKYYLAVMDVKDRPKIIEKSDSSFKKMYYKLLPQPNKMLPHVFFSKSGIETYCPSEEILNGYKEGKHIKGENFDIGFCHKLIDFFKDCIARYDGWKVFDFRFSPTSSYEDISGFYREVSEQGYKIQLRGVDKDDVFRMAESGRIYLFLITNRHLSGKSKSFCTMTESLKKALSENSKIQLNGGANIYYRPKLIEAKVTHPKGSWLVNKITKSGFAVPKELYKNIYAHLNFQEKLSPESELLFKSGEVVYKKADFDLIKDRRYSKEDFKFHVTVKHNYKSRDCMLKAFNMSVLEDFRNNEDMNILSVTRGEKNLLYCVLINKKGEVLFEKNFNIMHSANAEINFKHKLEEIEKIRMRERKEWQEIDKIRDAKDGFLGLALHEICDLMIKYNAVLVTENLDSVFKDSRMKIESNVYKVFESNLAKKLSCLILKNNVEAGSVDCPYQLVPSLDLLKKSGTQFGWMFFVNPYCISKISPDNGCVTSFNFSEITNFEGRKKFLSKFSCISFTDETLVLEYECSDFSKNFSGKKRMFITGKRTLWNKVEKKYSEYDLDSVVKAAFAMLGIDGSFSGDIRKNIGELKFSLANNNALELLIECIRAASEMKTLSGDSYVFINPSDPHDRYNGKDIDFISCLNLAKKALLMIESGEEGIRQVKADEYVASLSKV